MHPCSSKPPKDQVDDLISSISSRLYGRIWIKVEANPAYSCSWGRDHSINCSFLNQLIDQIKYHGKVPAVRTSKYMWEQIMGPGKICTGPSSQLLWYAHLDQRASFDDFQEFGGWRKPAVKQFVGGATLCGATVDKDYFP